MLYLNVLAFVARFPVLEQGNEVDVLYYHLKADYPLTKDALVLRVPFEPGTSVEAARSWNVVPKDTEPVSVTGDVGIMAPLYNDLSVPIYDQRNSSDPNTDCGPTAGAMILDYWDSNGYSSIKGLEYYGTQRALIDHIAVDMDTGFYGTTRGEWESGVEEHINVHAPYSFNATVQNTENYSDYKSSIDAGRPVGVYIGFTSLEYSYHWVAGRGYQDDWQAGIRLMKINNSRGSTDWINYDEYAAGGDLAFVWVVP